MRRVRLTPRGRAVVVFFTLLVAGAAAALVATASQAAASGQEQSRAGQMQVTVQPGDTLWSVTAIHLPSRDPYGMIEEVRQINELSGNTIHPGQQLLLPAG